MESEASAGTSHVATSATTTSSHELNLFSITITNNFVLSISVNKLLCVYFVRKLSLKKITGIIGHGERIIGRDDRNCRIE